MLDAMRGYLHAASGLTELTRKRAQELAQSLLTAGGASSTGAVAAQVSSVAEELINAAKSNRSAVREMVRGEVEVAVARLGLVPASELDRAHRKISTLEATVAELARAGAGGGRAAGSTTPPSGSPKAAAPAGSRPNRAAMKRAATKGAAPAAQSPSRRTPADQAVVKKAAVKKAVVKKAVVKKAAVKKAVVKKAAVKKAAVKKASQGTPVRSAAGTDIGAETSS